MSSKTCGAIGDDVCISERCKSKDIDMWPLLNVVNFELRSRIRLIYSFGSSAAEIIFTTVDNHVSLLCCIWFNS